MNRKHEKEMNSTNNQILEEDPELQMRTAALADISISARWKSGQGIQPAHTRILFYRNWDDKLILYNGPVLVVVGYAAIEN